MISTNSNKMNANASSAYRTSTEQKLKARDYAMQIRNGSPKLRDILRENCKIRMKESRQKSYFLSRSVSAEKRQLINTIIKDELKNQHMESDIELHEIILKEIFDNWEQWQNEEYEKELMALDPESNCDIFCPVCQKNVLKLHENTITCNCGLILNYPKSLPEFYETILMKVKDHENRCNVKLSFSTEPKAGFKDFNLCAFCTTCGYFSSIIDVF